MEESTGDFHFLEGNEQIFRNFSACKNKSNSQLMPNLALKDMYMLNYGIINNMNIEVQIDFINSIITLHVFISNSIFYFSLKLPMPA